MYKLDAPATTVKRIDVLHKKVFLRKVYEYFYKEIKNNTKNIPEGKILELGSGAGFIKKYIPQVVTSDYLKLPNVDRKINAEKLPFKDKSLSAILMLNVFHHINNPEKALREFSRCLKPGGKIIMIEPHNSAFGRFVNQNFHHEIFDPNSDWKLKNKGPLSGGNGAIPWIVFVRDKDKFEKKFSKLDIGKYEAHSPFKYIVSGGFTRKPLLPAAFYPIIQILDNLLSPINNYLGLFATIVIKKL